jgi:GntR family transcriptional regulator
VPSLKRGAPVPLYHQLKASILRDIEAGRWRAGDRLPTEDDLQMGYIRREQGRGTFVQGPPLEEGPRELKSFTSEMRAHGFLATSRVLEQTVVSAPSDVAASLQVPEGSAVFRLHRLRFADGEPMGLQTAYISMLLVPGIEDLSFADASLYEILGSRYSLFAASARESHQAVPVPEDVAALLRVPAGSPALAAERLAVLADGRPLEFVQSIMRGDRYKIVLDLTPSTR